MSRWNENKKQSLLNLSISNDIIASYKEWFVNNEIGANPNHDSICDLCGKSNLYWEYQIENKLNGNKMLIGSDCILLFYDMEETLRFNALVDGNIEALSKSEMIKHFKTIFRMKVIEEIRNKLNNIFDSVNDWQKDFMSNVLKSLEENKKLSPKQAHYLMEFIDIKINSIEDEDYFKRLGNIISVNLRRRTFALQLDDVIIKSSKYKKYFLTKKQLESI